ncbi:iron-siderophore ABC transporter substrate-binding protein [Nesterenkonia aurantiaca]|uniref:Iron complex transport system substrate-binding protein n=1 Tax=Nesterenkonia aurantiaca TaxID=1436010 RepID=A0A4R7G7P1_9MICC|nr:iron-siderophore ABC transporter substrate-binding protein [Nesterenkonia aurantiaca]TDS87500.1 iron complex transport system substrate-binding protein [Nesterenkonia aurantiaca]
MNGSRQLAGSHARRSASAGIALAATAALLLSGCADSSEQEGGTEEGGTEEGGGEAAQGAAGAYPASIETEFGEVTIEQAPERVVALGWGDAEVALDLGVEPVGASDWLGFEDPDGIGPWVQNPYTESPEMLGTLELSYEAVAALEPDLILDVRSSGDQERYDRLSSIAPTVGVAPEGANYLTEPEEQVRMIAAALGQPETGEEMLTEQEDAFAAAAQENPEWESQSVTVATRTAEGWGAYTEADGRVGFLEDLGFEQNPEIAELGGEGEFSVNISDEQLELLDADLLLGFPIFIEETEITEDAGWLSIPAVQDGRDLVITGDLANAFSLGTPEAQIYALEELAPEIEGTVGP